MSADDPKELVLEAQTAEGQGLHKRASELYSRAAKAFRGQKRSRDARAQIRKAIELSPASGRLYVQLAVLENELGNDESAVTAMEKFTELTLHRSKVEAYRPYMERHLKALPTLRQVFYRGIVLLDRTNEEPFLAYGQAAIQKSDWEDGVRSFLQALKTNNKSEGALSGLDRCVEALGFTKGRRALESFRKGTMPVGDLVAVLGAVSASSEKSGSLAAGKAVSQEEETLDGLIARLEAEMGLELKDRVDTVKPLVAEFRRRSDPLIGNDSKTRMDLAVGFFEMGLVEDARSELARVKPSDPLYLQAQLLLGNIAHHEGAHLEALECFQRCLREGDSGASGDLRLEAAYQLVVTYERLGDGPKALEWATKLEQVSPDYRDIRLLRKSLRERVKAKGKNA